MLGRSLKQLVTKVNPAMVVLLSVSGCIVAVVVLSRWYQIDIWISPVEPNPNFSAQVGGSSGSLGSEPLDSRSPLSNLGKDTQAEMPAREQWLSLAMPTVPPPVNAIAPLRVSNQTDHPLRVAVLSRRSTTTGSPPAIGSPRPDNLEPFHWDFAPAEGSMKGLVLSLPEGDLSLQAGDVVMAFAQDGSRRYWGPYVIGETNLPAWNNQTTEWVLILK